MNVSPSWPDLVRQSQRIIDRVLARLPAEIRHVASSVPCLFEPACADDPYLLGLYRDFESDHVSPSNGPIILYLRTIEDYCQEEDLDFATELEVTYLHEMGHHFGWDEDDLEARGLG